MTITPPSPPTSNSSTPASASGVTAPTARAARDEWLLLRSGMLVGATYLIATAFTIYFFATSHPSMEATPVEAAVGFRDAGGMYAIGTFLTLLPLPFALFFLGGLDTVLRRTASGPLVPAVISAGVLAFLIPAIGTLVSAVVPAIGAADTTSAAGAVVKAIDGVMPLSVALSGFPRAVMLIAVVVLLRRALLAGRGLAISGIVIAIIGLAGTGTFLVQPLFPIATLSAMLFVGWLTVLSVVLPRRATARLTA